MKFVGLFYKFLILVNSSLLQRKDKRCPHSEL